MNKNMKSAERELVKYIAMLVLLGCGVPATADIYQWVDRDGRIHFGDKAAKEGQPGVRAEKLDIQETAAAIDPDTERNRQQLRSLHKTYTEQREAEAQNSEYIRQQRLRLQQCCKILQDNIRSERRAAVLFRYDDAGNRVLWTAEERTAYREQLQETNRLYCGGAD